MEWEGSGMVYGGGCGYGYEDGLDLGGGCR